MSPRSQATEKKTSKKSSEGKSSRSKASPSKGLKLVIVESPAKAKTLKKYLGREFDVKASVGHIKDLPKSSLGVEVDNNFEPTYEVIPGKQKVVTELAQAAKKADGIFLAADPDREGEAIAWHVAESLGVAKNKIHRVLFHEITKNAVLDAIDHPIELNTDKYEAQQARRILDRLVGYKISPILWSKVRRGLSAGRVQSVAVKIITDREREIRAFVPMPYWEIFSFLKIADSGAEVRAKLVRIDQEKLDRLSLNDPVRVGQILEDIDVRSFRVTLIQKKERKRNPYPPFITSTLQQEASRRLYFSAKKTMTVAQKLYEGMELGALGTQGLITYMRTDSTRLSDAIVGPVREMIRESHGIEYVPASPNQYKNKKGAQDAHEAIRPTSLEFTPEKVKPFLEEDAFRLYDLIWKRFVACQMSEAIYDQTTVEFEAKGKKGTSLYGFRVTGSVLKFPGFLILWKSEDDKESDKLLPPISEQSSLQCEKVSSDEHQTEAPPRYNESSLIRELEELEIGRPSTYASILSTIQDRKYVEKKENRFHPTELGEMVTDLLVEHFKDIVDLKFTAEMEARLDRIEEGHAKWIDVLRDFYGPFSEELKVAAVKMKNVKREETPTDIACPKCGKMVVLKFGRNGRFAACQGYPDCRFTSEYTKEGDTVRLVEQPQTDEKCPACGHAMVGKNGRFGAFLACSNYPECKTTKPITLGIQCPECGVGELSAKRTRFGKMFYSCSTYPKCTYAIWDKPISKGCPQCQAPFLVEHYKKSGIEIRCAKKDCGYVEQEGGSPQNSQGRAEG